MCSYRLHSKPLTPESGIQGPPLPTYVSVPTSHLYELCSSVKSSLSVMSVHIKSSTGNALPVLPHPSLLITQSPTQVLPLLYDVLHTTFISSVPLVLVNITWSTLDSYTFTFFCYSSSYIQPHGKSSEDKIQGLTPLAIPHVPSTEYIFLLIPLIWKEKTLIPSCSVLSRCIFPNLFIITKKWNWDLI